MKNQTQDLEKICMHIPKAEMHIHIEGTFEPELMLEIAKRNNILIPYKSIEEVKNKYNFKNLQEFLDIYYLNCCCSFEARRLWRPNVRIYKKGFFPRLEVRWISSSISKLI